MFTSLKSFDDTHSTLEVPVSNDNSYSQAEPLRPVLYNGIDIIYVVGTILQCVIEISEKHFLALKYY